MRIGFAVVTISLAVSLFALRTYADECDLHNLKTREDVRAAVERGCLKGADISKLRSPRQRMWATELLEDRQQGSTFGPHGHIEGRENLGK
jgi:hypothetical protein